MSKKDYEHVVKILLIGDAGVGKTSILLRYTEEIFSQKYMSTIGIDFKIKNLIINEEKIKLLIWDTAGQERFNTITPSFYRDADAVLLIYSIDSAKSFLNMSTWIRNIEEYGTENVYKFIAGNKLDLNIRAVDYDHIKEFSKKCGIEFLEVSAKNNTNLDKLFMQTVCKVIENRKKNNPPINNQIPQNHSTIKQILSMAQENMTLNNRNCC